MTPMNKTLTAAGALFAGLVLAAPLSAQEVQPLQGQPLPGLSASQLERFEKGLDEFSAILTIAEGLGPVFNDSGCSQCHAQPAIGGFGIRTVTRFGKAATAQTPFDPLAQFGGTLLQSEEISPSCDEVIPAAADVTAERTTPPAFGAGLVQNIDDQDILALETNPPAGISGRAHVVQPVEGGPMRVGKFGWKGGVATMLTFSADAGMNEMGLTNRFFPNENAPNGDPVLLAQCDTVADPEDGPDAQGFDRIDRMADFQVFLAPPPQTPRSGMAGEAIFNSVGCADCHVSTAYVTTGAPEAVLNGWEIKPYSDFLLHDMGALGDGIVDGMATETEMKTPPLWGIAQRGQEALLHDSRATAGTFEENVQDAIDFHGGEGDASRLAFNALSAGDKQKVFDFLKSLGRAAFDMENDNDRDFFDWFFMEPTMTGPQGVLTPDEPGAINDADQDGDFDLRDFSIFMRAYTGDGV